MTLTTAQHNRLDALPENARVVGVDRECPLVEYPFPSGRVVRIDPSGRTIPATGDALDNIQERRGWIQRRRAELGWGPWPRL